MVYVIKWCCWYDVRGLGDFLTMIKKIKLLRVMVVSTNVILDW